MDKFLLNKSEQEILDLNSQYAEMFLNKVLRNYRKDQILKGIDQSLKDKNKEEFLRLTEELKYISEEDQNQLNS